MKDSEMKENDLDLEKSDLEESVLKESVLKEAVKDMWTQNPLPGPPLTIEPKNKSFIHNWLGFLFQGMISQNKTPYHKKQKQRKANPAGTKILRKIKERKL